MKILIEFLNGLSTLGFWALMFVFAFVAFLFLCHIALSIWDLVIRRGGRK